MSAIFKTTGPLDLEKDRAIYVERAELQDILHEIRRPYVESYVALLGPRQTGKTTLLFRVYRELRRLSEPVGFLDLSAYRVESSMQSYAHAAQKIEEELEDTLVSPGKLRAAASTVDSPIHFREFLLELARDCKGTRIVILLDEVGPFMSSLGFFETLRSISASGGRESEQAFKKYLFVFAGTVDLHELTTGQNSPLANVCTPVYLDGLGPEGTDLLVGNLNQVAPVNPDVAAYLHEQSAWASLPDTAHLLADRAAGQWQPPACLQQDGADSSAPERKHPASASTADHPARSGCGHRPTIRRR